MTNSTMINFDSENHETSYTSVNSVQCSTTISRSLPDLCSYVEDLEPQIATLDITSEDIDVPVKNFHSKLSLNNPKKVQFEDISSLKALSKTTGNIQASVETSLDTKLKRQTSCSYNQSDFVFTENLSLSDQSSESSTLDGYFQDDKHSSEFNSSSDKLEFTDISLNEDEPEEDDHCSVNEVSKVQSSKNGVLDSILDWVIPSNSLPKNKILSHQSQAVSSKPSTAVPNCSKSSRLSKNKMNFFRDKLVEPLSTTALILEDRPRNLPRKSLAESQKHRLEYKKMVEKARKNEAKKHEIRQRQLIKRLEHEENIANIGAQWQHEILPNWNLLYQTSKVRQLWWNGLPPNVRGRVWKLAIGNELNLTQDLYDIMVSRAHEKLRSMNESGTEEQALTVDREDTVELIRLDISRTFPKLGIFQTGGPYHDILHDILGAYVCYRPDVGYVQGMSFIAAMLLLNMEPSEVFLTFANLLNKPCQIAFYRLNEGMMKTYFAAFEVFFEENLPRLFVHFKQSNLTPDMYLIDWVFTMFSKALSLDSACRVWDIFCRDGEEFIFKTAIGILKLHQNILLQMEFIHAAQFLIKLPVDSIDGQQLFDQILHLNMISRGNRKWKDVLALLHNREESSS